MPEPVLPVIDLRLAKGSTRPQLAKKLYDALTSTGFFYLDGVENYPHDVLLQHTKWFFGLVCIYNFYVFYIKSCLLFIHIISIF